MEHIWWISILTMVLTLAILVWLDTRKNFSRKPNPEKFEQALHGIKSGRFSCQSNFRSLFTRSEWRKLEKAYESYTTELNWKAIREDWEYHIKKNYPEVKAVSWWEKENKPVWSSLASGMGFTDTKVYVMSDPAAKVVTERMTS